MPLTARSTSREVSAAARAEAIRVMGQYEPLVWKMALRCKRGRRRVDLDDLLNRLNLAAFHAALSWEPGHGANMTTWMYHQLRGTVLNYLTELGASRFAVSLSEPIGKDGNETLGDTIPAREEVSEGDGWDVLTAGLSDQERTILRLRMEQDLSFPEIGNRLGLPWRCVDDIYTRAIDTLRARP